MTEHGSRPPLPRSIGRYTVTGRIGRGAMGIVYSGRDEQLDREVALKVLTPDLAAEPELRQRFFREARLAAQLQHRAVVSVLDVGEEDGRLFIVMELLEGATLDKHLATTPNVTLEHKLDLLVQACEGLAVAHARGICHRDVKPANLFVQHDGSVKLLDFGIARIASSTLTTAGLLVGTPEYMSPEQARGEDVDQRSDVFSLGAVMYFVFSGRKPFAAQDLPRILHKVEHEDPPPLQEVECPAPLAAIVARALRKAAPERYQRVADLLVDLLKFRQQFDQETRRRLEQLSRAWTALQTTTSELAQLDAALGEPADAAGAAPLEAVRARFPRFDEALAQTLGATRAWRVQVDYLLREVQSAAAPMTAALERRRTAGARLDRARGLLATDVRAALREFDQALSASPTSTTAQREREACRVAVEEWQRAEDHRQSLLSQARAALADRQWDAAVASARQAAEAGVSHDVVERLVHEAETGRRDEAEARARALAAADAAFEAAVREERYADAEAALLRLGELHEPAPDLEARHTRLAEARAESERRLALSRACQEALGSARALAQREQHADAIAVLDRAIADLGAEPALTAERERVSAEMQRLAEVRQRRKDAALARQQAEVAWTRGAVDEAQRLIARSLDLDGSSTEAARLDAEIRAHLRAEADRLARESQVQEQLVAARAAIDAGQWRDAAAAARRALDLDPSSPEAPHLLAQAELAIAEEDADMARLARLRALEDAARPALVSARKALAEGHALRARWLAEAALALAPESEDARALVLRAAEASVHASSDADDEELTVAIYPGRPAHVRIARRARAFGRDLGGALNAWWTARRTPRPPAPPMPPAPPRGA